MELSTPLPALVAAFAESEHFAASWSTGKPWTIRGWAWLHIRDVFRLLAKPDEARASEGAGSRLDSSDQTLYVPASMLAANLLVRMQASRIHMAMVIDEFGGVDGVVTLEDVIEAVVGQIDDEHDLAAATQIIARAGGVFEADGRAPLELLETALGKALSDPELEEDIETAAGLVTALAGRVPQRGEVISHPAGLEFEITDADPRRVKRLRIRPTTLTSP